MSPPPPPPANGSQQGGSNNNADRPREPIVSPYMPKYPDPMSNISNFKIIESTLRGNSSLKAMAFIHDGSLTS